MQNYNFACGSVWVWNLVSDIKGYRLRLRSGCWGEYLSRRRIRCGWRKLSNEELHNLYSLPRIIRIIKSRSMRLAWYVAWFREDMNAYISLVWKPEGKRPLGRPRRRWVDNIQMDLREIVWSGLDWIDLSEDWDQWWALVNTIMNLLVP
jgi:hypothetical protein